jgi:hypothetical protein
MSKYKTVLLLFFFAACSSVGEERARLMSDELIKNLGQESSENYFEAAYFNKQQMAVILKGVREKCDYENRKGGFVNSFRKEGFSTSGPRKTNIFFIYEFYLSCDSVRFVLNYESSKVTKLVGFKVEPIETKNPMIIRDGQ